MTCDTKRARYLLVDCFNCLLNVDVNVAASYLLIQIRVGHRIFQDGRLTICQIRLNSYRISLEPPLAPNNVFQPN